MSATAVAEPAASTATTHFDVLIVGAGGASCAKAGAADSTAARQARRIAVFMSGGPLVRA